MVVENVRFGLDGPRAVARPVFENVLGDEVADKPALLPATSVENTTDSLVLTMSSLLFQPTTN